MTTTQQQIAILVSAVEHDRRHDTVLRDQAIRETCTPKQARRFWASIAAGVTPADAAHAALKSAPY